VTAFRVGCRGRATFDAEDSSEKSCVIAGATCERALEQLGREGVALRMLDETGHDAAEADGLLAEIAAAIVQGGLSISLRRNISRFSYCQR